MEIFIVEAGDRSISAVDIAYPQYCFKFDDIKLETEGWYATTSILKSSKAEEVLVEGDEDAFLDRHAGKVFEELLKILEKEPPSGYNNQ